MKLKKAFEKCKNCNFIEKFAFLIIFSLENTAHIEGMIQAKIEFLNEEKTRHVEQKKASEKQEKEIKEIFNNFPIFSKPEGNRSMADYMGRSDGRK